ncbi:PH domain-containing protein [Candidatus Chloroploca asiatica]|uniref:Bacterial Pleckstrin homology domain-containing protein n=1 Tax=Candidatus Chloroploca asiatica TaxID=1506545 RepID=A0A2H3KQW7_9CHLR|nr:PH domain-containing protein [Candidatus Chloroploca asiatica]PDW00755.1 hypothetical protein A9Q02_09065 [Candidatus Chloroploca asiatica]
MRRWKPQPSWRFWAASVLFLLIAAAAVYTLIPVGRALALPPEAWPINAQLFAQGLLGLALLSLAGSFGYQIVATATLWYGLDRDGLYIYWLGHRTVVPMQMIEHVASGVTERGANGHLLQQIGYFYGAGRLANGQTVQRFSTVNPKRALGIQTPTEIYLISPRESAAFIQELEQRRRIGPIQQLTPGIEAGSIFFYAFWTDKVVQRALVLAVLLHLVLLGTLMALYPSLPALIEMQTDPSGQALSSVPRYQILFLPLAGALLGLLNLGLGLALYQRTSVGARLLQLTTVGLQILFLIAAATILL